MSIRLIQDLHAGISRRDWNAVETAANRLRDEVEKTVAILAGIGVGSLPDDYPLSKLASGALNPEPQTKMTVADFATRLFDLHGFMLLETYRGKHAVTVTFPDLQEAQQFHNALIELSQHRVTPRTLEGKTDA